MRPFLLFLFLLPAKFGYAFEMNVSGSDIMRFKWGYLFSDLAVGDIAYADAADFCVKNGKLHLIKNHSAPNASNYSANLKVKIVPNNKVVVTVHPQGTDQNFSANSLNNPYAVTPNDDSCKKSETFLEEKIELYEVQSIAGFSDMLSYINHLKSLGFEYKP